MSAYPPLIERLAAAPADTEVTDKELAFLETWHEQHCRRRSALALLYSLGGPQDAEDHAFVAAEEQRIKHCAHIGQIVGFNRKLRALARQPERTASTETAPAAPNPLETTNTLPQDSPLTPRDLMRVLRIPEECHDRVRMRLVRWRQEHPQEKKKGWFEAEDPGTHDPTHLYLPPAVRHLLEDLIPPPPSEPRPN